MDFVAVGLKFTSSVMSELLKTEGRNTEEESLKRRKQNRSRNFKIKFQNKRNEWIFGISIGI